MSVYRIAEAAELLGVSDDTLRRWAEHRRFMLSRTPQGAAGIEGTALAQLAVEVADLPRDGGGSHRTSQRNQLRGIVTGVKRDDVMAQVDLCCGPYRVVSLISREAADDLGLEIGVVAIASVKSTNVSIEVDR